MTKSAVRMAVLAVGVLALYVTPAHAAPLNHAQISSILSVLRSFGADQATIDDVAAALSQSSAVAGVATPSSCISLARNLTPGMSGDDVSALQGYLIANGYLAGPPTGYYGPMTARAVGAFQMDQGVVRSTASDAYGYTGPRTREAITCAAAGKLVASPTSAAPGTSVTVSWAGMKGPSNYDWIGLYAASTTNTYGYLAWIYVSCTHLAGSAGRSGSCPFTLPTTLATGDYKFMFFKNNGYVAAATSPTIAITSATPTASLTVNGTHEVTVGAGDYVDYAWRGTPPGATATSTFTVDAPDGCGNETGPTPWADGGSLAGTDHAQIGECQTGRTYTITYKVTTTAGATATDTIVVHVNPDSPPVLDVTPTSAAPGTRVTVSWKGIRGAAGGDWIGLYRVGEPYDASHRVAYEYTNCRARPGTSGVAAGSCNFSLDSGLAGDYSFALFSAAGSAPLATSTVLDVDGSVRLSLAFAGVNRQYILHIPPHYRPGGSYPLMISYHGDGGTGAGQEAKTAFDAVADTNGFFAAYPDSNPDYGNGGEWQLTGADNDIDFSKALIGAIEKAYSIDSRRIYVSGFSMGGGMAQAAACSLADTIAGMANVSNNLASGKAAACHLAKPVTTVHFHGTADPVSYYNGGNYEGADTYSALQTARFWAKQDGCASQATTQFADALDNGAHVTDTKYVWSGCSGGTTAIFYGITDAGHAWPGDTTNDGKYGPTSLALKASQIIWDVLSQVRR